MSSAAAVTSDGVTPVVAVEGVTVVLGGLTILDNVSIAAAQGRITGLIGPNGAGKTTVFNVLSGFVRPVSGTVSFEGARVAHVKPHQLTRLGVARTLQGVGLCASLTVLDNVALAVHPRRGFLADALALPWSDRDHAHARSVAGDALAALGVGEVSDRLPGELPYPIQKRVALARALASEPRILLLDEPAGGISADDIAELAQLMRSWTPAMSILLVEHHMELVMDVCDDIWVLDAGQVIAHGAPAEIASDPAVIAAYLGEEVAS